MVLEDLTAPLSRIYGPSAIYPQQIERRGGENGFKRAVCFYEVPSEHVIRESEPPALDRFEPGMNGQPVGILDIIPQRAIDHFRNTAVFPGHKGIRAAVAYSEALVNSSLSNGLHTHPARLISLAGVSFVQFVLPGSRLEISEAQNDPSLAARTVYLKRGQDVVTEIKGLKVGFYPEEDPPRSLLLPDQMIEAMIQSAAATALDLKEELDGIPMFQGGIGCTRFFAQVSEGTKVEIATSTTADKRGFNGSVAAFVNGDKIAESRDMRAMIIPRRVAEKLGFKLTD